MRHGYHCESCEASIFPTTVRSELEWLKARVHVVREVAKHSSAGLESWMSEGLAFLNDHEGHDVGIVGR